MATTNKGAHLPPSYTDSMTTSRAPYAPGTASGYGGQQPPVQQQNLPPGGYYPAPSRFGPVQQPPPAYNQQQQTTGVVVVGGAPAVTQNVLVVQTVRANVQIPEVYPGPAFCLFAPGLVETFIRSSIVVMLLILIAVAAATIEEESKVIYDEFLVDATGWQIAAGWVVFVAGLALITEGIMLLLRFLNPRCFNNSYGVFGGLDITKCVLAGIGLFIGCVITGIESAVAEDDLTDFCNGPYSNPDNNEACAQLEKIQRLVIALTAINVICMILILILFIWDIIYLSAGFNSKIPVPRGTEGQQHQ